MDELKIEMSVTEATYLVKLIERQLKQPDQESAMMDSLIATKDKLNEALIRAIIVI